MTKISIPFDAEQVEALWMHLYNVTSCHHRWVERGEERQWEGLAQCYNAVHHSQPVEDGDFVAGTAEFDLGHLDCLVVELERVTLDPDCFVGMDTPADIVGTRRELEGILYHIAQVLEGKEIAKRGPPS